MTDRTVFNGAPRRSWVADTTWTSLFAVHGDWLAIGALLTLSCLVTWAVIGDAATYIRADWPTFFFPMYAFLGRQLRAFDVPGWNPYQFSGAPFAGDPSTGWGYLPAMVSYALLPAEPATTLFIGSHIAISGAAAYVLARLIGLRPAGAFVAGCAYAFPWLVLGAAAQILYFQVHTWLPAALIGVELARRPGRRSQRFGGIALAGLAISQILAAWLGQGSYYALLVIGGWVAWRTLATPPIGWSLRQRLAGLLGIGAAILLVGFALNAMALLIRLDVNSRSNIPGGSYSGISRWEEQATSRSLDDIAQALAGGFSEASGRYAGAAVLVLAILAPFVVPRWPPLLFWLATIAVAIALAVPDGTLQTILGAVLPRFELIHGHFPGRVLMVLPLAAAMLAGATADAFARGRPALVWRRAWLIVPVAVLAIGAVWLERNGIAASAFLAVALAIVALSAVALALPIAGRAVLIPVALAAIIVWEPTARAVGVGWAAEAALERSLRSALADDVDGFLYDNEAAAFLRDASGDAASRYAAYDPALLPIEDIAAGELPRQAYRSHWAGEANWLLALDWATWFEIADVQGYNPLQVGRYTQYIDALNGHLQEYHETDIFPAGLGSPLLNPLNLRYFVLPANAPNRPELAPLMAEMPTVYEDEHVRIVENPEAFPRAWLVHEAQQVAPGEALAPLAAGTVDPRRLALLESPPPPLGAPPDPAAERATYVVNEPDRIILEVNAEAPALLMLSEVWDPGWSATVDGEPAPVLLANHVFRAVPVPGGVHQVELRYEPPLLRLGILTSLATAALLLAAWLWLWTRERRPPPEGTQA